MTRTAVAAAIAATITNRFHGFDGEFRRYVAAGTEVLDAAGTVVARVSKGEIEVEPWIASYVTGALSGFTRARLDRTPGLDLWIAR